MLKRPTKKTLSEAESAVITSSSAAQTVGQSIPKSYDPAFPVFDIPVNKKVLVYIPNHIIEGADGAEMLRMDKFAAHPIKSGRTFGNVRCTDGVVVPSLGLDGTCPLCAGIDDCWSLYNAKYKQLAKMKGIEIGSPEEKEALKQDRRDLMDEFAIKQADIWYTFPIIVIECEEKDGKATTNPKKTADGKIIGTPMWYSIRERTYLDKWVAGFDSIQTDDGSDATHPAGRFAILNFTYQPKSGEADKMGSAKALKVTFKEMGSGYDAWATYFDKSTEAWTPAKAQEVVVLDVVRDMTETTEECNAALKKTREELDVLSKNSLTAGNAVSSDADAVLGGLDSIPAPDTGIEMPALGDMGV